MCHRELCKMIDRQLERVFRREICEGKELTEQRSDKRIFYLQKRTAKQENALLSQVLQQKKYMQITRQSRKCHTFVKNIDNTMCLLVTTSIKGHKQEAVYLLKRFQWVNISIQSVNDSLQDQTV